MLRLDKKSVIVMGMMDLGIQNTAISVVDRFMIIDIEIYNIIF